MTDKPPPSLVGEDLTKQLVELSSETPPGAFVEVGVYKGGTAWHLARVAREQGRELHLFDTWTGMPYALEQDNHKVGDFSDTDVEVVRGAIPDAHFHVGVFPETLPEDLQNIAFVHADCDQYQSVRDVIDRLSPRMVRGGVMLFDDYGCTWGATKAVNESFTEVFPTRAFRGYVRF